MIVVVEEFADVKDVVSPGGVAVDCLFLERYTIASVILWTLVFDAFLFF